MSTVLIFITIALAIAIASVVALDRWLGTYLDKEIDDITGETLWRSRDRHIEGDDE